jgi:hypothetical protein
LKIVTLSWNGNTFVGYQVGKDPGLYSSIRTLPLAARDEAAKLLLEDKERLEQEMDSPFTEYPEYLQDELDLALSFQKQAAKIGRPKQVHCQNGHSLRGAYVDSRGKRQCRTCHASRQRERRRTSVLTKSSKTAGQAA